MSCSRTQRSDAGEVFTVCLVNSFVIPKIRIRNKQGHCPNLADRPNLPDFVKESLSSGYDTRRIKK